MRNSTLRQNVCWELIRYGKILIDIEIEKYCCYFRRLVINYNSKMYEVHLKNGFCTIIKNLLT